jgi:hypothetical protein
VHIFPQRGHVRCRQLVTGRPPKTVLVSNPARKPWEELYYIPETGLVGIGLEQRRRDGVWTEDNAGLLYYGTGVIHREEGIGQNKYEE